VERRPKGEIADFGNWADSIYPMQLRSATEEFRGLVKHRFLM